MQNSEVIVLGTKPSIDSKLGIGITQRAGEINNIHVTSIAPGSTFAGTPLKVGMRIQTVNGRSFDTCSEFVNYLKAYKGEVVIIASTDITAAAPSSAAAAAAVPNPLEGDNAPVSISTKPTSAKGAVLSPDVFDPNLVQLKGGVIIGRGGKVSAQKVTTKATAAKASKKEAKEKRLKRFRSNATIKIRERIERAISQRLFLVKTSETTTCPTNGGPLITFTILGSTGNVYEVTLSKVPHCSCPDHRKGNLCKHLLFVMLKVVGLSASSPLVYQSAYLTNELDEIMEKVQNRMSSLGVVVANEAVRQKLTDMEKKAGTGVVDEDAKASAVKRKEVDGSECPICFDDLGSDIAQLTFCQAACGTNYHKECMRMWTSQHRSNPKCPICRQPWGDVATGGKTAGGSPKRKGGTNREGYVNVGELQGQSPVRDTSTYHFNDYYNYKRRRY